MVLSDVFFMILGGIAVLLTIARPIQSVLIFVKIIILAKDLFLKAKTFASTGCVCYSSYANGTHLQIGLM